MSERRLTLSSEDEARVREVEALVASGADAVPALVSRLADPSWAVRRNVVAGLALLGTPAVAPLIQVLLTQRDDENRLAAAVDALAANRGDADEPVLALVATMAPPPVLCDAAQVLGRRRVARAVPLLARLTRHEDDNVAVAAVEALGRIGDNAGVDALIGLAGSDRFFRVFPTIEVLGKSGDPRAVPALLALVDKPLYSASAAAALAATGDQRALPALAKLLGDAANARPAALALVELDDRRRERFGAGDDLLVALAEVAPAAAAPNLVAALAGAELGERCAIAQVLGWVGGPDAVGGLFRLLGDEPAVAQAASASLRRLRAAIDEPLGTELAAADSARRLALLPLVGGRARHLEALLACLGDVDPAVRTAACDALARSGDVRAVPRLFELLGDDARVAQAAVGAIQSLGSAETERLTLAAAASPVVAIRRAAFRIIGYFGYQSGVDALLGGAQESDARVRETAIAGLAYVEGELPLAAILAACHAGEPKTRAAAVRALGLREPSAESRKTLHHALEDPDGWVRYYACQALGRHRDESATEPLIRLLADPAGQVRVAAVESLARLRHRRAIAALDGALGSDDPDVHRAALVGLGQSQRPEALPILLEALGRVDASTRVVVISALAVFAEPEVDRALAGAARDDDEYVASAAVELLAARPGALATRLLAELAGEVTLRERILRTLSLPGEGRVEGLRAALEEAEGERGLVIAGALARLHRPDAYAALVEILRSGPVAARRAAATALRLVPTPLAREALETASARDPDAGVRRSAALALEG